MKTKTEMGQRSAALVPEGTRAFRTERRVAARTARTGPHSHHRQYQQPTPNLEVFAGVLHSQRNQSQHRHGQRQKTPRQPRWHSSGVEMKTPQASPLAESAPPGRSMRTAGGPWMDRGSAAGHDTASKKSRGQELHPARKEGESRTTRLPQVCVAQRRKDRKTARGRREDDRKTAGEGGANEVRWGQW